MLIIMHISQISAYIMRIYIILYLFQLTHHLFTTYNARR